jgi:hypothetical protein
MIFRFPEENSVRVRFAWLPKIVYGKGYIWLENYILVYSKKPCKVAGTGSGVWRTHFKHEYANKEWQYILKNKILPEKSTKK